jgi:hypothetical protein
MYYFLSLGEPFFSQTMDDLSLYYQVNSRIIQVMQVYMPDDPRIETLRDRLDKVDAAIEAKEKSLRNLGSFTF